MMAEALLYPGARWHPLGAQTEARMTGHDIVCLHTMVGYLISTDRYFRITNGEAYRGTESHYGVGGKWGPDLGGGLDGASWQWQDRAYEADANLNGNPRVISIETADNAPQYARDIEPWTPKQVEELARILAWESTPAAHAKCPSTWTCHKVGIPLALIPDTKPGRRGIGYHRQGIAPWRVDGGVQWSESDGKECPGDRRVAQVPTVIARARAIIQGGDDMELSDIVKTDTWDIGKRVFGTDASLRGILVYAGAYGQQAYVAAQAIRAEQTKARLRDEAILLAVKGVNEEAILARIDQVAAEAAKAAEADAARDGQILQLLQDHATGTLDAEEVVQRIGELLVADSTPTP